MAASLLLSRVLGMVRDMVIGAKFGQSDLTDAYFLSFQIPDLLFYLIAGGALSAAFIPVFSEYLHTGREEEAWHVFSVIVTLMSIIVGAFIVFSWIFAEPLVGIFAPGAAARGPEFVDLVVHMSRIVVPAQYAFFIGGIMLGTLYARQVFSVPGLAPNVYNLGIIFGAVVLANVAGFGVLGMSWGALVGAYIGNIVIPFAVIRRMGVTFKLSLDLRHEGVKKVLKLMLPVVLGLSLPGVFGMILRSVSSLGEVGMTTAIEYGNRLMQAPLGVFGQALALAVFPALAQFFAQGRMDLYRDQLEKTLRTVLFLTVPISAFFLVAPEPVVQALFERGAFTAADTARTAAMLQMFGIGVFAWCLQPVLMRSYYAVQKTLTPILFGTATTLLFGGAVFALHKLESPPESLAVAASIAAIVLATALLFAIRREIGGLNIRGVFQTLGKALVASAVAVPVAWFGSIAIAGLSDRFGNFLYLGALTIVFLLFAWTYYFVAKLIKMPETKYAEAAARSNRNKSGE